MYISAIEITGFRGLETSVVLNEDLTALIGPNNAGKTAVVDAIRIALQPYGDLNSYRVRASDFSHNKDSGQVCELTIRIRFSKLNQRERGIYVSCLTRDADGEVGAMVGVRATMSGTGQVRQWFIGGLNDHRYVEPLALSAARYTHLPALRDAERDLRPGYTNRLTKMFEALSAPTVADLAAFEAIMDEAHDSIKNEAAFLRAEDAISQSLRKVTRNGPFAQESKLSITPQNSRRILSSLRLLAGSAEPHELEENGLGANNLIYMAALLATLKKDQDHPLKVLLVEEPEAHLHPQLQQLLMKYFEAESGSGVQVILTSHSPQFASTARVERIVTIRRAERSRNLSRTNLTDKDRDYLHRFLDVTKSSLLFAENVILVEGVAEQLALPALAGAAGYDLASTGTSVISVDGVGFTPFLKLFDENGLAAKCLCFSDGDPKKEDITVGISETHFSAIRSATARKLMSFDAPHRDIEIAKVTFEWDLAFDADRTSRESLVDVLGEVHPVKAKGLRDCLAKDSDVEWCNKFLDAVSTSKGIFALELYRTLADQATPIKPPKYIEKGLQWLFPTT